MKPAFDIALESSELVAACCAIMVIRKRPHVIKGMGEPSASLLNNFVAKVQKALTHIDWDGIERGIAVGGETRDKVQEKNSPQTGGNFFQSLGKNQPSVPKGNS